MNLLVTKDGSHTLHSPEFNEIYHSRHGAIQESRHVFVRSGLEYIGDTFRTKELKVFEVGFGTGLNALLTMLYAEKNKLHITYDTVELYPLPIEIIKQLNYTTLLGYEFCYGPYHTLHLCRWEEMHDVTTCFRFKKSQTSALHIPLLPHHYHLIYYDAFAPERQAEMWTVEVFAKMYQALVCGGCLVTYCSKSAVQRNLRTAGFEVEKLPGPPGKREMIRAHKK